MRLAVELSGTIIGHLDGDHSRSFDFHATDEAIEKFGINSAALSVSIPLVGQTHIDGSDGRLALAVNGKYRHADITQNDLVDEFSAWGLRGARSITTEALDRLAHTVRGQQPLDGAADGLKENVMSFTTRLLGGEPAGTVT